MGKYEEMMHNIYAKIRANIAPGDSCKSKQGTCIYLNDLFHRERTRSCTIFMGKIELYEMKKLPRCKEFCDYIGDKEYEHQKVSMTIQEYWAKLVAAGLTPESKYAWADSSQYKDGIRIKVWIGKDEYIILPTTLIDRIDKPIQLRKDGIDLVYLEWRKLTKQDKWKEETYDNNN